MSVRRGERRARVTNPLIELERTGRPLSRRARAIG
jgi:hypothetical protein